MEKIFIKCAVLNYFTWIICNSLLFFIVVFILGVPRAVKEYKEIIKYSYYKGAKEQVCRKNTNGREE